MNAKALPPVNGTRDAQCAPGHAGPKCEPCDRESGYVRKFGGRCSTCAQGEGVAVMLAAPFVLIALVVLIWFLHHKGKLRGLNRGIAKRTIKARILFGFATTITRMSLVYGLVLPSPVEYFYNALGFVEVVDISGFISGASCMMQSDYTTKVYVQTSLALSVFAVLGALYVLAKWCSACASACFSSGNARSTAGSGIVNAGLLFAFLIFFAYNDDVAACVRLHALRR